MGKRMWDIALTNEEQEKATDDYIIGCLKCAEKHFKVIEAEDKMMIVAAAAQNLEKIRMLWDERSGQFGRRIRV
jgi:hypothetical protein